MKSETNSKSSDTDVQKLRVLLDTIASQLSVPFLERRGRSNTHKTSPVEELQDAVNELCEKEREMGAAIGIAKMLLDENEALAAKNNKLKLENSKYSDENRNLKYDLKNYVELLKTGDYKYEKISETLASTETELLKFSADHERLIRQKSNYEDMINIEIHHYEINQIKSYYQKELETSNSNLYLDSYNEINKNLQASMAQNQKLASDYANLRDQYDRISVKYKKTADKLKEAEKMNKIVVEAKEKIDKKYKQLSINYNKARDDIEKLEEELKISEVFQKTKTSTNGSIQESNSLLSELQCIETSLITSNEGLILSLEPEEDIFSQNLSERRYSYTPNSKTTFRNKPILGIMFYSNISIQSKTRDTRKDPSEEYFILATQAVKMNSPHMDTICIIPHSILYEKATKENIPFQKWHSWIESQLNFEYIQALFRKKKTNNFGSFKRFLKRF